MRESHNAAFGIYQRRLSAIGNRSGEVSKGSISVFLPLTDGKMRRPAILPKNFFAFYKGRLIVVPCERCKNKLI